MRHIPCLALLSLATGALASTGQIDTFSASETTVLAGTYVDFTAVFSVQTSFGSYGGENLNEPEPAEGSQSWLAGWSVSESELLNGVYLGAAGQSFQAYPGTPAGGAYSGQWSFSLQFSQPGVYLVDLSGGWTSNVQQVSSTATGSRDCWNSDPGGSEILVCSAWAWDLHEDSYDYVSGGAFEGRGVEIRVLAVPEPATLALGLVGLLVIPAAAHRRRREQAAA